MNKAKVDVFIEKITKNKERRYCGNCEHNSKWNYQVICHQCKDHSRWEKKKEYGSDKATN